MGEETYVTPVAAAAAASINFTGGGILRQGRNIHAWWRPGWVTPSQRCLLLVKQE